eukprot:Hpha_TRINITY_DN7724_c0_g1::TRINITY_DN7724_c0_g1_i1::g.85535::m.85535
MPQEISTSAAAGDVSGQTSYSLSRSLPLPHATWARSRQSDLVTASALPSARSTVSSSANTNPSAPHAPLSRNHLPWHSLSPLQLAGSGKSVARSYQNGGTLVASSGSDGGGGSEGVAHEVKARRRRWERIHASWTSVGGCTESLHRGATPPSPITLPACLLPRLESLQQHTPFRLCTTFPPIDKPLCFSVSGSIQTLVLCPITDEVAPPHSSYGVETEKRVWKLRMPAGVRERVAQVTDFHVALDNQTLV